MNINANAEHRANLPGSKHLRCRSRRETWPFSFPIGIGAKLISNPQQIGATAMPKRLRYIRDVVPFYISHCTRWVGCRDQKMRQPKDTAQFQDDTNPFFGRHATAGMTVTRLGALAKNANTK